MNIVLFLLTFLSLSLLGILTEVVQRKFHFPGEVARKTAHFLGAFAAALMPLWLSWLQIGLMSGLFVVVMLVSRHFNTLQAVHDVSRRTWGEVYLPLAGLALAIVSPPLFLYSLSMIILAIADPAAYFAGTRFSTRKVRAHAKSLVGSCAFFVCAFGITISMLAVFQSNTAFEVVCFALLIALPTTIVEYLSPYGSDNLTIPLAVTGLGILIAP